MAIFKNFKCPNGLPPEECMHAPQVINNIASYFTKKELLREDEVTIEANLRSTNSQNEKSKNINKTLSR